jgi:general secretion pathway protein A
MYASFFGLRQSPFSMAPDPHMLFMSKRHREALAHLLYGVGGGAGNAAGAGGGFVLLTGEIGTGKTTVCRCFLEQIPPSCNVAYIFNPKLTVIELLQSICEEFHLAPPAGRAQPSVKDYIDPLNAFLLQTHAAGQNNVLIIDEAQNLSADVLEQLRLLTNLETSERKLLQIVLIGQPQLRVMLQQPELEQLAQRVIARYHLEALTEIETAQYIQHRLEVSGLKGAVPFDQKALRRIHRLAQGVPRRINLLCDRALLGAYAGGEAAVGQRIVAKAATEVFDPPLSATPAAVNWRLGLPLAVGALAGVLAGVGMIALLRLAPPLAQVANVLPADLRVPVAAAPAAPGSAAVQGTDSKASAAGSVDSMSSAGATGSVPEAKRADAAPPVASPAPALLRDANQAWRELALAWKIKISDAAPCEALPREQLRCFSAASTTLAQIRQLGRPGILTLDSRTTAPSYALLTALTADRVTLRAGGSEQTVTLAALAARWDGEFSTLWRVPPDYNGRIEDRHIQWAAAALAKLDGAEPSPGRTTQNATATAAFRTRVRSFQIAEGLPADGVLGPMTFMQLNRRTGVDEPVLATGP